MKMLGCYDLVCHQRAAYHHRRAHQQEEGLCGGGGVTRRDGNLANRWLCFGGKSLGSVCGQVREERKERHSAKGEQGCLLGISSYIGV